MVVPAEDGLYIIQLPHGGKESGTDGGTTDLLPTSPSHLTIFGILCGHLVLIERNVEEGKGGNRTASIRFREGFTLLAIPSHLIEMDVVVAFDAFDLGVGEGVDYVQDPFYLALSVGYCQDGIAGSMDARADGIDIAGNGSHNLQHLVSCLPELFIMIAKSDCKGDVPFGNGGQNLPAGGFGRLAKDDVARVDDQIGLLGIQYGDYVVQCTLGTGISGDVVGVGQLQDFEFAGCIEGERGCFCCNAFGRYGSCFGCAPYRLADQ